MINRKAVVAACESTCQDSKLIVIDLFEARRVLHSCVQAAAAARVAAGPDILDSALDGDGVSVLCHVIADANAVKKRDHE